MTDHAIPPRELIEQWASEKCYDERDWLYELHIATRAAQWGADQELEACCVELSKNTLNGAFYVGKEGCPSWHHFALKVIDKLRAARRPKPPSLKEQAYIAVDRIERSGYPTDDLYIIRRALEQLDD
jgi:hypothetical protein